MGELGPRNRKKLNEGPTIKEVEDHCEGGDQYNLSIHRQFRDPEVLTGAGNLPADPAHNLESWELVCLQNPLKAELNLPICNHI